MRSTVCIDEQPSLSRPDVCHAHCGACSRTSVIGNSSLSWIKGQISTDPDKPFFAYIAPHGPHISDDVYPYWTTPAPWYNHTIPDTQTAPRTVSWNKQNKGAHPLVANQPLMNEQNIAFSDGSYRRRLEATMSVDDIVGDLVQLLEATNQINNTYIFFTSDVRRTCSVHDVGHACTPRPHACMVAPRR